MKRAIFFLDYSKNSGNGHLQRCREFKKVFPKNFKIIFITSDIKKFIKKNNNIYDYGVIDSYKINYNIESKIKKICKTLITIDDLNNRRFASDIIINYSPLAKRNIYLSKSANKTKLLLGSKFNFVRKLNLNTKYLYKNKLNLFFYFGKQNKSNLIHKILKNIKNKKIIKKIYIFGGQKKKISHKLFLKKMDNSDILLTSSGLTLQEGISKKKIIFSKYFSLNQYKYFKYYKSKGYINSLDKFKHFINLPIKKINFLLQKQYTKKIDTKNYDQILNIKNSIFPIRDLENNIITIKEYKKNFCKHLYNLQTKDNRKFFFDKRAFTYQSHKKYLVNFLSNQNNLIFIIFSKREFAGYIKFELINKQYYVSIVIHKKFRGKGIATKVLYFFKSKKILSKSLFAEVKNKNLSSLYAFKKAGFNKKNLKLFN